MCVCVCGIFTANKMSPTIVLRRALSPKEKCIFMTSGRDLSLARRECEINLYVIAPGRSRVCLCLFVCRLQTIKWRMADTESVYASNSRWLGVWFIVDLQLCNFCLRGFFYYDMIYMYTNLECALFNWDCLCAFRDDAYYTGHMARRRQTVPDNGGRRRWWHPPIGRSRRVSRWRFTRIRAAMAWR